MAWHHGFRQGEVVGPLTPVSHLSTSITVSTIRAWVCPFRWSSPISVPWSGLRGPPDKFYVVEEIHPCNRADARYGPRHLPGVASVVSLLMILSEVRIGG